MTFSPIVKRYVYLIKKNNLVNGKMSIKIGFSISKNFILGGDDLCT